MAEGGSSRVTPPPESKNAVSRDDSSGVAVLNGVVHPFDAARVLPTARFTPDSSPTPPRFTAFSPAARHHCPFPSPPPSPLTLRKLQVKDVARRASDDEDEEIEDEDGSVASRPNNNHPVLRKRLSQRLAAWSKTFRSKFKKSASLTSGVDVDRKCGAAGVNSSVKLKHELLTDRVVASDGRTCTLTRRRELDADLSTLLRSAPPAPPAHPPLGEELDASPSATQSLRHGLDFASGDDADLRPSPSSPSPPRDGRTPVGIVQSAAFVSAAADSKDADARLASANLCRDVEEPLECRFPGTGRSGRSLSGGAVVEAEDEPPPELPPRRRRVQSIDNMMELPTLEGASGSGTSGLPAGQIVTSMTTDDVASLRLGCGATGNGDSAKSADMFAKSIERLKECGWYWGPLSWEEASIILRDKLDGSFLVRDSSDDRYILSLSIRCHGRTLHTRIQHYKGLFSFWQQPWTHGCDTIVDFIEKCMTNSRNGKFMYFLRPAGTATPPMPLLLLHPVSRLFKVPTLHHLCRFVVLKSTRRDNVKELPIPQRLKDYLNEPQYLFEDLISSTDDPGVFAGEGDDED